MKLKQQLTHPKSASHSLPMLDYRQIRAARALLNWSQADLAKAAGMATSSIKNIESESSSARKESLDQVFEAFDLNGVEFTPCTGVRLKNEMITVHDGKRASTNLLDDIYLHAQASSEREVCIIGLDEKLSSELEGPQLISAHIERLGRAGVTERILVCEGQTRFLDTPLSYRWMPRKYFSRNAPIYIYGDRIAFQSGSLRRRSVIIEARPLAQHMRMLFDVLWTCIGIDPETRTQQPWLRLAR